MIPRCHVTVHWYECDLTVRCLRPDGHAGAHRDGVWWFDDHGLRVPQPSPGKILWNRVDIFSRIG